MLRSLAVLVVPLLASCQAAPEPPAMMKKVTIVLLVDAIEPALPFWVDKLGYSRTMEAPQGEGPELAFVGLVRDGTEIMLQTRQSVREGIPALADEPNRSMLFLEVEDIDAVEKAVAGEEIVVPRRTTSYGATEVVVRAPGGHLVILAEMAEPEQSDG